MAHDTAPGGVELRLDISPSGHPSMVVGEGPGATTARAALGDLYEAHGALIDLGKTVKDQTQIGPAAIPHMEKAVARAAAAQEHLAAQITTLHGEIDSAVKGTPTSAAQEIRAHWKGQKSSIMDLGKIFGDPVRNADTVAAIVAAPSYLSGLTEENVLMLRDQAAKALVPEKREMIAETRLALSILDKAAESFAEKTTTMLRKWASKDAEIIADRLSRKQGKAA